MHPPHVPLEPEAQPVGGGRLGDARPRRRLLGDGGRARDPLVDGGVHLLEELHGLEVLAAAVDVRRPLARRARVVEVEHRGDAVDAQAVGVELLEPVERVRVEVVAHLATTEVEDVGAPLLVPAPLRVGVLVERGAVEAGQRPLVGREVPGHPVQEHADAALVERVDEPAEAVGVAEAGVRREVRRHVVAPRAAERVLHDRHQLDVAEAEVGDVGHQLVDQLVPAQHLPVPLAPRREVHLVDRHRLVDRLPRAALLHPGVVAPLVGGLEDPARRRRRDLGPERHRVGLLAPLAVGAEDHVLVAGARPDRRHEELPDARVAELAHRVLAAVPAVEVALEPDAARAGRPDGERRAGDVAGGGPVVVDPCTEHGPQQLVATLVDQVQVHLAERRQEPVGVVDGDRALAVVDLDAVVGHVAGLAAGRAVETSPTQTPSYSCASGTRVPSASTAVTASRQRLEGADRDAVSVGMRPEDRVRLPVLAPRSAARSAPWTPASSVPLGGRARDLAQRRHRDRQPRGSVARLVDALVDGLVRDVRRQQGPLVAGQVVPGVGLAGTPTGCAPTTRPLGRRAARCRCRRWRPRSSRRPAARSRRSGACPRRRARASPARPARPAAWPARPRSRRSSSPWRCAGSGPGGGRRGRVAPCPTRSRRRPRTASRSSGGVRRQLGHHLERRVEPCGHGRGQGPMVVGRALEGGEVLGQRARGSARPPRRAAAPPPAKSPPTSSA